MNDNLFNRIESKTNVNKDTIIALARKLQDGDIKNENTINDSMFILHINIGQIAYIINSKKCIVWNGTEWTNIDGTTL